MANSEDQIPWKEIGAEHARAIVAMSDNLRRNMKETFANDSGHGIPDFEGHRCRYELAIFTMFWMWYVANTPKFISVGATKPLLDAYHRGCCEAVVQSGLIENNVEALRRWEDDLHERFLAYKNAWEAGLAEDRQDHHLHSLRLISGEGESVGRVFARYLFLGQKPRLTLVMLLNEFGSVTFTELVQMLKRLESRYQRNRYV
jgi:hypothetical protein